MTTAVGPVTAAAVAAADLPSAKRRAVESGGEEEGEMFSASSAATAEAAAATSADNDCGSVTSHPLLTLYATTNRGIEQEAVKDITRTMCDGDGDGVIAVLPGHIFFRTRHPDRFTRLRSVENVNCCVAVHKLHAHMGVHH